MSEIDDFVRERDEALASLDEARIRAYHREWNGTEMPADPEVFWGSVHKAIAALPGLPADLRRRSREWLEARGWRPYGEWARSPP